MIPTEIILHHSATKDSGTVSWNAIRRYHQDECNWNDIGYHFGVEYVSDPGDPAGSYEILLGRLPMEVGAHCKDHNNKAIGICFVGDFDEASVPEQQWKKGVKLVKWLCSRFGIPVSRIYGHRDFATKTCPGTYFDIEKFKDDVMLYDL